MGWISETNMEVKKNWKYLCLPCRLPVNFTHLYSKMNVYGLAVPYSSPCISPTVLTHTNMHTIDMHLTGIVHWTALLLTITDWSNNCMWCTWLSWWWMVSKATQEVHLGGNLKEKVDNGDRGDIATTWFIHPHPSSKTHNCWVLQCASSK